MKSSQKKVLFTRENYILVAVGLVVIMLGFLLMSGGNNEDVTVFNPDIFSSRRIFWAPLVVILGFVIEMVAIFYEKKEKKEEE
ncbi:MAG: DUF3098 domain-containing protein [Flavobacteriales bacterium]|jgi:uncharacterized membrane protein|nr:DUF3098 domain-containing protein [Flavobacteriales bacterium]MBQ1968640.1 DUF3098 domain-containing protein [Flavobacteriales bacterium]MBQ5815777.1 DUF3098 domain-containing protein [Flavobacteriales bacterium]MBR4403001.1 DUF3098 domain-containing protein [Flavobacteriales bacterium]